MNSMPLSLPPAPDLPANLADESYVRLLQLLGLPDNDCRKWMTLALYHASFLNERVGSLTHPIVNIGTLDLLGEVGKVFTRLGLFHHAYTRNPKEAIGKRNDYVTQTLRTAIIWLQEIMPLTEFISTGKGETPITCAPSIWQQLLGVIGLCYGYQHIYSLLQKVLRMRENKEGTIASYKNALQNYAQTHWREKPEYRLLETRGPDHNRTFRIRVATRNGRYADAEGGSKTRAEELAARLYMERFATEQLAAQAVWKVDASSDRPLSPPVPDAHRAAIEQLCGELGLTAIHMSLVSQALIHPSYVNESPIRGLQDYKSLAQVGSQAVEALTTIVIALDALSGHFDTSEFSPVALRGYIDNAANIAVGFDVLNLDRAFLLGKGQRDSGLTNVLKAECLQALSGAVFLANGSLEQTYASMAQVFADLVSRLLAQVRNTPEQAKGPKSQLQELLQPLRIGWNFQFRSSGLAHEPEYEAKLVLSSAATGRRFVLGVGTGKGKKQAEEMIARLVCRAITETNSSLGLNPKSILVSSNSGRQFVSFLLRHEFAVAPANSWQVKQWCEHGYLGSQLLATERLADFSRWAAIVASILQEESGGLPDTSSVLRFYQIVMQLRDPQFYRDYMAGIAHIVAFVRRLDPGETAHDTRHSPEFSELLALSKVAKLMSSERKSSHLPRLIDDFILWRRGRYPTINLTDPVTDTHVVEHEGAYHLLLEEWVYWCEQEDIRELDLAVSLLQDDTIVEFRFGTSAESIARVHARYRAMSDTVLWDFLSKELGVSKVDVSPSSIVIWCRAGPVGQPLLFGAEFWARWGGDNLARIEYETTGRLLHDLKNQLVAYQVAIGSAGADRTSQLKSKYEASLHLDTALALCRSLEAITRARQQPNIEPVDLREFLRHYVANKMTALPQNIRITPPTTLESCQIWTAPDFVHAILENLVKNAVEAMSGGGEIQIDWIYDLANRSALIEVSDNGPGIEPDRLKQLLAGRPTYTAKTGGSGIGLFTVQSMLQTIGGLLSAESKLGRGTRWMITIPSLVGSEADTTAPISTPGSIKEVELQ